MERNKVIHSISEQLTGITQQEARMQLRTGSTLPSTEELGRFMELIKAVLFPAFYPHGSIKDSLEDIHTILSRQITRAMAFTMKKDEIDISQTAIDTADKFVASLPEIRENLLTDIEAVAHNDPAVTDFAEVVFSYPVVKVMTYYRTAHKLLELGVPMLPRILAETAHSLTGIDIHPAARIGKWFSIDHGTGVVIGATAIIGDHVMLYQGVTLGARNFRYDKDGKPIDEPRHPILEDNVTVYSNTSILGRVTIGHDTVVGGNIWLTHSVQPHSRILQGKTIEEKTFSDGEGI
ncbi:MAG: serine acetyltransferase [Bacteroidaceae bacterium]|nr:serine acetyltransferase [Bacteroidaceae bacterium]